MENQLSFEERIVMMQNEAVVTKDLHNKFSDFNYRSAEMILEKIKPICQKLKLLVYVTDDIELIGDRYYVCATAHCIDCTDRNLHIEVRSYAREPQTKTKFDDSQITGSSSSYARKYALSGLLNLDDRKDADTENPDDRMPSPPPVQAARPAKQKQTRSASPAQAPQAPQALTADTSIPSGTDSRTQAEEGEEAGKIYQCEVCHTPFIEKTVKGKVYTSYMQYMLCKQNNVDGVCRCKNCRNAQPESTAE